jgi:hypothetical protein
MDTGGEGRHEIPQSRQDTSGFSNLTSEKSISYSQISRQKMALNIIIVFPI